MSVRLRVGGVVGVWRRSIEGGKGGLSTPSDGPSRPTTHTRAAALLEGGAVQLCMPMRAPAQLSLCAPPMRRA